LATTRSEPDLWALSTEEIQLLCVRNLLAGIDERVFFKDRDGRFLMFSDVCLETYGQHRKREDLIGTKDSDFFSGPHAEAALADELSVMETGEPMPAKLERETFDGRPDTWARTIKLPLRDEYGNIVGTWGIARDVTAQIAVEHELDERRGQLKSSEQMHRVLLEQNPQPMWGHDVETLQIVAVNGAAQTIYGYSQDEFLAMKVTDVIAPADVETYLHSLLDEPPLGSRGPHSRHHRYKDGTVVEVEVTSNDVTIDGRACRISSAYNVTERNRAAAELAAARDAAVEASEMKSAFLANISHEIRTPMNGVLGMAELLLDSELSQDQLALAQHVIRSGELMVELINDILDISKIEAGQLDIEVTDFRLRETIEDTCAVARPQARAKGLELEVRIAEEVPDHALGDGKRLRQIVLNLVSNAVKFTSEGKVVVQTSATTRPDGAALVRIEVIDTGIGIEAARIETMFEPFTQADVSTTRNYGGTGLGLAIARELTLLMGGKIGAESKPGAGSTFWIELPLLASTGPSHQDLARSATDPRPEWLAPPRVLVVEDSPINQIVAVRTLEHCGCRADVAGDGLQALEALSAHEYDAILMDCQMPVMDGFAATIELRRRENGGRRTPVIAMTANATANAVEECLAAGMDDYVGKPVRREQLLAALGRWVGPQAGAATSNAARADRS